MKNHYTDNVIFEARTILAQPAVSDKISRYSIRTFSSDFMQAGRLRSKLPVAIRRPSQEFHTCIPGNFRSFLEYDKAFSWGKILTEFRLRSLRHSAQQLESLSEKLP